MPESVGGTATPEELQQLPPEAIDILYSCDASEQEGMPMAA